MGWKARFDWTPERIETLRKLWGEGMPAADIGLRMGVARNSVYDKAQRLGLKKRGNWGKRQESASRGVERASFAQVTPQRAQGAAIPKVDGPVLPMIRRMLRGGASCRSS